MSLEKQDVANDDSDESNQDFGDTHEEVSHEVELWDDVFGSFSEGKHLVGCGAVIKALEDSHGMRIF